MLGPGKATAKTFSDASTRNMIEHLAEDHGITKENQEGQKSRSSQRIEEAFRHTSHPRTIHFNKKIFKQLLVRWIIVSNISFRQVEIPAFRFLLAYLCACVSFHFSLISRALMSTRRGKNSQVIRWMSVWVIAEHLCVYYL